MNEIAPGILTETIEDGKIHIITIKSITRPSVNAWAQHIKDLITGWEDTNKPYLVLYDFTDPKVSFTPYVREKSAELTTLRPEVTGRIAVVLSRGAINFLVMLFAQLRPRAARQIKIFFDKESALAWLNDGTTTQKQQTRQTDA
ncbi:MAG: hypothetical protein D6711_17990 [Chloroflexi bacterium]|nr:MAG: hypothetical protein D6711_17990 [Chloroflexota bacterium]